MTLSFHNIYELFLLERDVIQYRLTTVKVFFKLAENQLHGFHNNSSDLTHPNSEFLGGIRTTRH